MDEAGESFMVRTSGVDNKVGIMLSDANEDALTNQLQFILQNRIAFKHCPETLADAFALVKSLGRLGNVDSRYTVTWHRQHILYVFWPFPYNYPSTLQNNAQIVEMAHARKHIHMICF